MTSIFFPFLFLSSSRNLAFSINLKKRLMCHINRLHDSSYGIPKTLTFHEIEIPFEARSPWLGNTRRCSDQPLNPIHRRTSLDLVAWQVLTFLIRSEPGRARWSFSYPKWSLARSRDDLGGISRSRGRDTCFSSRWNSQSGKWKLKKKKSWRKPEEGKLKKDIFCYSNEKIWH